MNAKLNLKEKFPFTDMDKEEINMCICEFKKYINLVVIKRYGEKEGYQHNNHPIISMSSEIMDKIWYNLILFTIWYSKMSKTIKNTARKNRLNNTLHNDSENRKTIPISNKAYSQYHFSESGSKNAFESIEENTVLYDLSMNSAIYLIITNPQIFEFLNDSDYLSSGSFGGGAGGF